MDLNRDFLLYLQDLRRTLESAWDDRTRHPGTQICQGDAASKGQCGVSTAYLAAELERQNHIVVYCTGHVAFPLATHDIDDHCWLKMKNDDAIWIIDLTADQNGYERTIVFDSEADLLKQGVVYRSEKERSLSHIKHENFLTRLKLLMNKIDQG